MLHTVVIKHSVVWCFNKKKFTDSEHIPQDRIYFLTVCKVTFFIYMAKISNYIISTIILMCCKYDSKKKVKIHYFSKLIS